MDQSLKKRPQTCFEHKIDDFNIILTVFDNWERQILVKTCMENL